MNSVRNLQRQPNPNYYVTNNCTPGKKRYKPTHQTGESQPVFENYWNPPLNSFEKCSLLPPEVPQPDSLLATNSPQYSQFATVTHPSPNNNQNAESNNIQNYKSNSNENSGSKNILYAGSHQNHFRCHECKLWLSSQETLDCHLAGSKHARKLQELKLSEFGRTLPSYVMSEGENSFKCALCNVFATSLMQIKSHIEGAKHTNVVKSMSESKESLRKEQTALNIQQSTPKQQQMQPTINLKSESNNQANEKSSFYCSTCNKFTNSQIQYDQHMSSKKHASKVALVGKMNSKGAPQKRKYPFAGREPLQAYFVPEKKIPDLQEYDAFDPSFG